MSPLAPSYAWMLAGTLCLPPSPVPAPAAAHHPGHVCNPLTSSFFPTQAACEAGLQQTLFQPLPDGTSISLRCIKTSDTNQQD